MNTPSYLLPEKLLMFTRRVAIHPSRQEAFEDLLRWMTFASPEAKADGFALWRVLLARLHDTFGFCPLADDQCNHISEEVRAVPL